jgi:hypothetical protein
VIRRSSGLLAILIFMTSCHGERARPPELPALADGKVSDAERREIFAKAAADSKRNAKVTRRPRRFSGDSL